MQTNRATLPDLLRIILCVGVVFHHMTPIRPASGPFMVLGFFVMSGFLLGRQFESLDKLDVSRFYDSKARRLLPMFLAALITGFVLKLALFVLKPETSAILPNWQPTEWGNINPARLIGFYNAPLWFMWIILFMFLCAPLLFWLYKKKYALYVFLALCLFTTWGLFQQIPYSSDHECGLYYSPITRSWQFVAGMAAAKIYPPRQIINAKRVTTNIILVFLLIIFLAAALWSMLVKQATDLNFWNYTFAFDFGVVFMFCMLIPLLFSTNWKLSERAACFISWLAILTYPIYLFHVPIYNACVIACSKFGIPHNIIAVALSIPITLIASIFAMRIQKRFFG